MSRPRLSPSMTLAEFDHGYWYATELKRFADTLGTAGVSTLRKDELEVAIKRFLRTGAVARPRSRDPVPTRRSQPRDVDLGLDLRRRIARYTNDAATKSFLEREARKMNPAFRRRSGAMYRLNRWREAQFRRGVRITYRDLVREYVRLSQSTVRFARIPHVRYINFVADFMKLEPAATRAGAIRAWKQLKEMDDLPKTYQAWATRRA